MDKRKKRRRVDYSILILPAAGLVLLLIIVLLITGIVRRGKRVSNSVGSFSETGAAAADENPAAGSITADSQDGTDAGEALAISDAEESIAEAAVIPETVTITVSACGDCTLGRDAGSDYDTSFNASFDDHDPGWFFENAGEWFGTDDLTIVNFEGVLSTGGERQHKTYAFRGSPDYVKVLTEGSVEAANLANNHSFDYGEDAYEDTKRILADAGIVTFGYDRSAIVEIKGIKVGLTGTFALYDDWDSEGRLTEQIEWCRSQGAEFIISSFHWGYEGTYEQSELQEHLGHTAIDAGADLVIGHHPHRLQPHEVYKGRHILYSLGNFCFGGNRNPSDMDCAICRQTFTFEDGVLTDTDDFEIVPFSISSAEDYNNYKPTPLEGDAAERAMGKIYTIG